MNKIIPVKAAIVGMVDHFTEKNGTVPRLLFLGNQDLLELRNRIEMHERSGLVERPPRYQGLEVFVVNRDRFLMVSGAAPEVFLSA